MRTVLRHVLSILLLPFLVVVVVPSWLLTTCAAGDSGWADGSSLVWLWRSIGVGFIGGGFVLFSWCVILFVRLGQGTLAPWDPTRTLVTIGPYRFVRNPMISGVALMLIGLALLWGSRAVCIWACIFIVTNHIYFVLSEERGLEKRFGEQYRRYKANVPRWIPRRRPWSGK